MKTILTCLFALFFPLTSFAVSNDNTVVARIGKKEILKSDFNRWIQFGSEQSRQELEKNPKQQAAMLRQIVTSMVIADQAKKERFDKQPEVKENMDLLINNFLTIEYLDKMVAQKVEVSEQDIKAFYEQNKDKMIEPERIRARHILVKVNRAASEKEIKQARKKTEKILKRIKKGEDFAQLATELSEDPGSKTRGGDVGYFSKGRMAPEFEKAAFSLQPGKISDIVQTNFGFHIIKLEDREPQSIRPYSAVKDQLQKKVAMDKKKKAVDEYVQQISKDAGIEILFDNLFTPSSNPHMR